MSFSSRVLPPSSQPVKASPHPCLRPHVFCFHLRTSVMTLSPSGFSVIPSCLKIRNHICRVSFSLFAALVARIRMWTFEGEGASFFLPSSHGDKEYSIDASQTLGGWKLTWCSLFPSPPDLLWVDTGVRIMVLMGGRPTRKPAISLAAHGEDLSGGWFLFLLHHFIHRGGLPCDGSQEAGVR